MLNFLWVKIEEKFTKTSHAFRYFDEKCRSKISFKEFEKGIEKLRIKFHRDDMKEIFNYLDTDQDRFLNYVEFAKLNQNSNFTSRLPGHESGVKDSNGINTKLSARVRSTDIVKQNGTHRLNEQSRLSKLL